MPVSDDDLRSKLRDMLPSVDLQTETERSLREKLQEHFECNLKDRKQVFKDEIQNFLAQASSSDEEAIDVGAETDHAQPTRKRKTGLATGCTLSPEMQEFLGVDQDVRMSRAEVVKAIWAYIKANDLQDPKDKRKFLKDPKLELIFKYPVNMLSLNRQLSRHVKPSGDVLQPDSDEQQPKVKKAKTGPAVKKVVTGDQPKPKKPSAFSKPLKLSPELSAVVGTTQASRGECQKLLWAYIKEHGLQCPENKSTILVHKDELLHKVLQVKECSGFGMSKYLKDHFLGPSD